MSDTAGHSLGQQSVPGEHVPGLRHLAPGEGGLGQGGGEVVQLGSVLQMIV